jgi:CRISPR-associated protein Csm2
MNTVLNPGFKYEKEFRATWINEKIDEVGINYLENLGFYLTDKRSESDNSPGYSAMTTSQIRNIFGEIKRIQLQMDGDKDDNAAYDWQSDFLLLRPKIAYNTARVLNQKKDNRIKAFREVLELAHTQVKDNPDNFKRFSQFVEGIIAYHKVYGGRD